MVTPTGWDDISSAIRRLPCFPTCDGGGYANIINSQGMEAICLPWSFLRTVYCSFRELYCVGIQHGALSKLPHR